MISCFPTLARATVLLAVVAAVQPTVAQRRAGTATGGHLSLGG